MAELSDFAPGDKVLYIPTHAHGDSTHEDCEHGIVSSVGRIFVFVKYIRNGIKQDTPEGTAPEDLVKI